MSPQAVSTLQLEDWAASFNVRLPIVPTGCEQSYHMFHLLLPSLQMRSALIEHLRQHRILAVFHYIPLHLSPMGTRLGGAAGDCPVAEDVSERIVRLPFYTDLSEADQDETIAAFRQSAERRCARAGG